MAKERGTFTFLYTDIENSSSQWEADPGAMSDRVAKLNDLITSTVEAHEGKVFKSLGDGLAAIFDAPHQAVLAAICVQDALAKSELPKIRIGIHTGYAEQDDLDYQGTTLNRVSRLTNLGHGGQILISEETSKLAKDRLPPETIFKDLGIHAIKGHEQREHVCQVGDQGFPKLRGLKPNTTIPVPDRAFVGRSKERAEIVRRLGNSSQRLITILGFGGMGKTTLAQVCAAEAQPNYADGAYWVPCEGLQSPDQLVAAISSELEFTIDPSNPIEGLCARIDEQQILLVLDCFEGLVSAAEAVDDLLRNCKNLQILVTSRILLNSPFEYEFELQGMIDPKAKRPNLKDAIELFRNAGQQVRPNFVVNKGNQRIVSELVRALECVPLAIILVASRLRHRTLEELSEQVKRSVLETARRVDGKADRHANLWHVIDMSFGLLAEDEQEVLTKLSVFAGGFDMEAAEAVLEVDDLVVKVARLRDNSMVSADQHAKTTRYRQLDSVREYAREVVDAELWRELQTKHSKYYVKVAQRIRREFNAGNFSQVASSFSRDGVNLRQATRFAVSANDSDCTLNFVKFLARPLLESGQVTDFELLSSYAIDILDPNHDRELLGEIYGLKGIFARRNGQVPLAFKYWTMQYHLFEGNSIAQSECLADMIWLALLAEDSDKVKESLQKYQDLNTSFEGDKWAEHQMLIALSEFFLGNVSNALRIAENVDHTFDFESGTDSVFFVTRALSEFYRNTGNVSKSIRAGKVMLKKSLEGEFVPLAAQALVELARTWESFGNQISAEYAANAVLKIPKFRASQMYDVASSIANSIKSQQDYSSESWKQMAEKLVRQE